MKLKLSLNDLEKLYKIAEYNYKRNNAYPTITVDDKGEIRQRSGYPECNDFSYPVKFTVVEEGLE